MTRGHRLVAVLFHHLGLGILFRWIFARRLVVLTYHGVVPAGPGAEMDRERKFVEESDFVRQLEFLKRRYRPVSLEQVERALADGSPLPSRAVLITFDDGYENNLRHAAPHLERLGIPAAVFAVTDLIGTGRVLWVNRVEMWWTERERRGAAPAPGDPPDRPATMGEMKRRLKALPPAERDALLEQWIGGETAPARGDHPFRMMSWDGARELERRGIAVASHTATHAILAREDEESSRRELVESKRALERELGHPVRSFAYPNGNRGFFLPRDERLAAEAGYSLAFSTIVGLHRRGDNPYAVRRVPAERDEGWVPLLAARMAFPYELKVWLARLRGSPGA